MTRWRQVTCWTRRRRWQPPYRRFDVDVAAMPKYFTVTKQEDGNYKGAIELKV